MTVVNVSEKREKELNVFLNNASAQGRFDEKLLADVLMGAELTLSDVGLTDVDLEFEFGTLDAFTGLVEAKGKAAHDVAMGRDEAGQAIDGFRLACCGAIHDAAKSQKEWEEQAIESAKMRQARQKYYAERAGRPQEDTDYMVLVCFKSASEKEKWLLENSLAADTYMVSADRFVAMSGLKIEPLAINVEDAKLAPIGEGVH